MFESVQTNSPRKAAERLLAFLLSVSFHILIVTILVVLPLLFIRMMPGSELFAYLLAPPRSPATAAAPVPIAASPATHQEEVGPRRVIWPVDFVPGMAPKGVPLPGDDPPMVGSLPGVYGFSLGAPGASGLTAPGLPAGLIAAAPPPIVPPPPRPQRPSVVRVGGTVQEAKLLRKVLPVYPEITMRARISGEVKLEVLIDEEGDVADVRVLHGHVLLVEEATRAVKQWKYSPTLLNGEPVAVISTVTVIFQLR